MSVIGGQFSSEIKYATQIVHTLQTRIRLVIMLCTLKGYDESECGDENYTAPKVHPTLLKSCGNLLQE